MLYKSNRLKSPPVVGGGGKRKPKTGLRSSSHPTGSDKEPGATFPSSSPLSPAPDQPTSECKGLKGGEGKDEGETQFIFAEQVAYLGLGPLSVWWCQVEDLLSVCSPWPSGLEGLTSEMVVACSVQVEILKTIHLGTHQTEAVMCFHGEVQAQRPDLPLTGRGSSQATLPGTFFICVRKVVDCMGHTVQPIRGTLWLWRGVG